MSLYEQVINKLANEGWIIKMNSENIIPIPEIYSGNTFGFEEIAKKYQLISNQDYTTWFVTGEHLKCDEIIGLKYRILGGSTDDMGTGLTITQILNSSETMPYLWDTFKNISIGASMDNGKTERAWWDKHLPFIMSSKNGYDEFYVINTEDGSIEHGEEPSYEDTEIVANSLDDFWKKIIDGEIIL